jgi:hypothetical protein
MNLPPRKPHFWFKDGKWHVKTNYFLVDGVSLADCHLGLLGEASQAGAMATAPRVARAARRAIWSMRGLWR